MGNFFNTAHFSYAVLCSVMPALVLNPLAHLEALNVNLNDVNFLNNIQKIAKKAKKNFEERKNKKLIENLVQIKNEINTYYNCTISLEKMLENACFDIRNACGKSIHNDCIRSYLKTLRKAEKKNSKSGWFFEVDDQMFIDDEFAKQKKREEGGYECPTEMEAGLTLVIIGSLVCLIPHPAAKRVGGALFSSGMGMMIKCCADHQKENENQQKEEEKEVNIYPRSVWI